MRWGRKVPNAPVIKEIQRDVQKFIRSPIGMKFMTDLAIMWGFWGPPAEDVPPNARDCFIWILDRAGINHIENVENMMRALLRVKSVEVESEFLDDEDPLSEFRDEADDESGGTWQRPPETRRKEGD